MQGVHRLVDPGGGKRPVVGLAALALVSMGLLFGVTQSDRAASRDGVQATAQDEAMDAGLDRDVRQARIRSVTLSARRPPSANTLADLQSMGLSHLTLVPFAFQRGITSTDLRFRPDARWYTESDNGIRALADSAGVRGMRVILKPHIWVGRGSSDDEWRSNINFETDADWATWEAAYRSYIMHHAALAQQIEADIFVVGTELMTPATKREQFWRDLIGEVRTVFSGRVTYAANWWREYAEIQFWDELDFIGVQAYFPLATDDRATAVQLHEGWQPHLAEMHGLSVAAGKPVLFTEIGYRSFTGATERPWEWPSREQAKTGNPDDLVQASLYDAFFQTVWEQEWFAGAILWRWYSEEESGGSTQRIGFTPQNKPAEEVIRNWFRADALLETSR